jgi:hypothetical protein
VHVVAHQALGLKSGVTLLVSNSRLLSAAAGSPSGRSGSGERTDLRAAEYAARGAHATRGAAPRTRRGEHTEAQDGRPVLRPSSHSSHSSGIPVPAFPGTPAKFAERTRLIARRPETTSLSATRNALILAVVCGGATASYWICRSRSKLQRDASQRRSSRPGVVAKARNLRVVRRALGHDLLDFPARYFVTLDCSAFSAFASPITLPARAYAWVPGSRCTSRR